MQLGKYSTDRDNILHFMATSDWANDSFGNVEAPTGYVWKMSNDWEDVHVANTEFNSLIESQMVSYDIEDTPEFRNSLAGHFLLKEDSNGFVFVFEFETEAERDRIYSDLETEFSEWDSQDED